MESIDLTSIPLSYLWDVTMRFFSRCDFLVDRFNQSDSKTPQVILSIEVSQNCNTIYLNKRQETVKKIVPIIPIHIITAVYM